MLLSCISASLINRISVRAAVSLSVPGSETCMKTSYCILHTHTATAYHLCAFGIHNADISRQTDLTVFHFCSHAFLLPENKDPTTFAFISYFHTVFMGYIITILPQSVNP